MLRGNGSNAPSPPRLLSGLHVIRVFCAACFLRGEFSAVIEENPLKTLTQLVPPPSHPTDMIVSKGCGPLFNQNMEHTGGLRIGDKDKHNGYCCRRVLVRYCVNLIRSRSIMCWQKDKKAESSLGSIAIKPRRNHQTMSDSLNKKGNDSGVTD